MSASLSRAPCQCSRVLHGWGRVAPSAARRQQRLVAWRTAAAGRRHLTDAERRQPRPENVPGDLYVDETCIDCDTCRWMAPDTFARVGEASAVVAQPPTPEARHAALQALLSCPTYSIHCRTRTPGELAAARDSFPLPVPGCPGVHWCGYAAENTYGGTSYFIQRPQGNILVDVPRWTPALAQRLAALGGVRWMFLTHRDDVGDHEEWARFFSRQGSCQRIIHRLEASPRQGTDRCEVLLDGEGPWQLDGTPLASSSGGGGDTGGDAGGDDVWLLFTPGHTRGCVSLLHRPSLALFSGDTLAWSARLGRLTIFRAYNWHSVAQQLHSVAALRGTDFLHVLPGHGRRAAFPDAAAREAAMAELLAAEGYAA